MYNESRKWLITFVLALLTILIISFVYVVATNKPEIPDPQEVIIYFDDDVFFNGDGVLYIETEEGKWFIEAHRIE